MIYGAPRGVAGHDVLVQTCAVQFGDGSVGASEDVPQALIDINYHRGLTSAQARELAATLVEAADDLDGWAQR